MTDDEAAAPLPPDLEDAEKRLRRLLERRNELNAEARELVAERDQLNTERRRVLDAVAELRARRDAVHGELQQHKTRRNELQRQAKELLEAKKARRMGLARRGLARAQDVEGELRALEWKHATTPLSQEKEKALMKEVQALQRELAEARKVATEETVIVHDLEGIDERIDALFRDADAEHAEVVRLAAEAGRLSDEMSPAFAQADTLRTEADKKHAEFVKLRERADHYHARAEDLRGHVLSLREAESAERAETDREMRERRDAVERSLADPEAAEERLGDVIDRLKKGGKVRL